jgi:5-methyltetrahydropteroyltriglutamate--homocysteine methyltransferase
MHRSTDRILTIHTGSLPRPRDLLETVWAAAKIPDGAVLIPGVTSHSTVLVEHPELIAQRIARYAASVGRENVIAGSDCGFATFAGSDEMHESIVWAKFSALAEGARIASRQLWAKRGAAAKSKAANAPKAKAVAKTESKSKTRPRAATSKRR